MNALAIQHDQTQTRGAARGRAFVGGCRRASTFDHDQVHPEVIPSLPAGERNLMGGCAARRQTRPRGSARALEIYRAIRPPRRFILGWTGDLDTIADVRRLILSGLDERLAALLVAAQSGHQPGVQALADLPEIHSKTSVPFANDNEAKGVGIDQNHIGTSQNVDYC